MTSLPTWSGLIPGVAREMSPLLVPPVALVLQARGSQKSFVHNMVMLLLGTQILCTEKSTQRTLWKPLSNLTMLPWTVHPTMETVYPTMHQGDPHRQGVPACLQLLQVGLHPRQDVPKPHQAYVERNMNCAVEHSQSVAMLGARANLGSGRQANASQTLEERTVRHLRKRYTWITTVLHMLLIRYHLKAASFQVGFFS